MIWVRRGMVFVLSLILFVSLVDLASSISLNNNLTQSAKLETWLTQSNVYNSLVTNELHNAQQSATDDQGAGRVSLNDPAVQQAVRSVFSARLLQSYTQTFLNSNYAWLEGKASTPQFTINLTAAKQQLAQQVGQQVKTRLAGLPACSSAQLAQLQATLNTDPLSIACLPPSLTPATAAAQATAQINGSSDFLNHPVITANSLNPNSGNQGQPYYQKLSALPKLYRLELKLPWIAGVLALLSMLGVIFLSSRRRRGVKFVSWILLAAGLVLIVDKFLADTIFNYVQKRIFDNSNISQLQQSLTAFLHQVETQLVKTDLWFGIAFVVLAVILLIILWFTGRSRGNSQSPGSNNSRSKPDKARPSSEVSDGQPTRPLVYKQPAPRPKQPPRLIQ